MSDDSIYHMAHKHDWEQAATNGTPYQGSADDKRDGFMHFSTAAQMRVSAAKHRAGQRDLLLIEVKPSQLGDALKWEASRDDMLFPHLYGALNTDLAATVTALPWDEQEQVHVFPDNFPG